MKNGLVKGMNKETRVRPSLEENCDCVLDSVASRALQHSGQCKCGTDYQKICRAAPSSSRAQRGNECRSWRVEEPETMPPAPPGALIPNTCPNIVEQSFENTKAVGVATVHSAKASHWHRTTN